MLDCISVDIVGVPSETKTATVGLIQVTLAMKNGTLQTSCIHRSKLMNMCVSAHKKLSAHS